MGKVAWVWTELKYCFDVCRAVRYTYNERHNPQLLTYTGYTQKNGAVSKVNKKFISQLTRAQHTPSATATVQVSHALPAVRFSCLLWGQFPRWRRSRKRPFCVFRFEVSRSVITVQREFRTRFRKDTPCVFSKPCTKLMLHCNHRSGHLKTEYTESLFLL